MPSATKSKRSPRGYTKNHTKRHGRHHKKGHDYAKIYAPYIPLVISIIASLFVSFMPKSAATLAWATEMSRGNLLAATNVQRSNSGKTSLTLNSQLNQAAQAKANHMVVHNYWSHTTPDGQQPWVFIDNAGYNYQKAGENLAYGFTTSASAITGWMNSPTHKTNMLDGSFREVGFGFANSNNFNGDGKQTVVVAMYGQPQVLSASTAPANTPAASAPAPSASTSTAAPAPSQAVPKTTKPKAKTPVDNKPKNPLPITTEQTVAAAVPVSQNISNAQAITGGSMPWLYGVVTLVIGLSVLMLLIHHSLKARHLVHDLMHGTERFVLHHPLLESTLLGLILFGIVLSRTVGTIL